MRRGDKSLLAYRGTQREADIHPAPDRDFRTSFGPGEELGGKRKLGATKQHMQPGNSSGVGCLNALRCASRCWRSGSPPAGLLCREKPPRSPDQPVTFSGHLGGALGSTGERHPSPGRGGGLLPPNLFPSMCRNHIIMQTPLSHILGGGSL